MELLLILGIVLLIFGGKKLPDLARSIGKSSREFKKGIREADADDDEEEPQKPAPALKPVGDDASIS
jgi:sec-independent protein translocase protein TatA